MFIGPLYFLICLLITDFLYELPLIGIIVFVVSFYLVFFLFILYEPNVMQVVGKYLPPLEVTYFLYDGFPCYAKAFTINVIQFAIL